MQSFKLFVQTIPRSFNRFILISLALLGLSISSVNAALVNYDETVGGDLINGATTFNFDTAGVNSVSGSTEWASSGFDSDGFFFNLADGLQITDVSVVWSNPSLANLPNGGLSWSFLAQAFSPPPLSSTTLLLSAIHLPSSVAVTETVIVVAPYTGADRYWLSNGTGRSNATDPLLPWHVSASYDMSFTIAAIPAVPVPPAVWLFGTGILGLIGFSKRKTAMPKAA